VSAAAQSENAVEIVATIRGSRRTGHGVVTIERRGRSRRYRVTLARLYWLRFWLIICCPWRVGGAWLNGGFDAVVSQRAQDNPLPFRQHQWRDFRRRNWKRLPRAVRARAQSAPEAPSHNCPAVGRTDAAPPRELPARVESMQGASSADRGRDYADFDRQRAIDQGYGMRSYYREPFE